MVDDAKSGTHLAEAKKVLTFLFSRSTTPLRVLKFHSHWGCPPKKKGQHLLCCTFCVTFGPNRHRARVSCYDACIYRDKRLNTVVVAMLAD